MNYAFHSEAETEFKHAIDYCESCSEGLGYDFAVEVCSTIEQIVAYPKARAILEEEVRREDSHMEFCAAKSRRGFSYLQSCIYTGIQTTGSIEWSKMPNQALHPTPEAGAFFASAISGQNFPFAKSSLASGAGELYVRAKDQKEMVDEIESDIFEIYLGI